MKPAPKKQKKSIKKKIDPGLQRYKDIEEGRVIPTFIEFFSLCIIFGIEEKVNIKEMFPAVYNELKKNIEEGKKNYNSKK